MRLDDPQRKKLHKVLCNAFTDGEDLYVFVKVHLGKIPDDVAPGKRISARIAKLIEAAEANGFLIELITEAQEAKSENKELKEACEYILSCDGLSNTSEIPPSGGEDLSKGKVPAVHIDPKQLYYYECDQKLVEARRSLLELQLQELHAEDPDQKLEYKKKQEAKKKEIELYSTALREIAEQIAFERKALSKAT